MVHDNLKVAPAVTIKVSARRHVGVQDDFQNAVRGSVDEYVQSQPKVVQEKVAAERALAASAAPVDPEAVGVFGENLVR